MVFEEIKKPEKWYGVRFTQIILLFTMLLVVYGLRVTLSVGIVAMTDSSVNSAFPTYNWNDKSIILSSMYWGYIIPQVLVGQLAERYGPKWILMGSMCIVSITSILIPIVASFGSWAVMICRIVQGFFQAPVFPSLQYLLSKWAPLPERSRMGSLVYSGIQFGTAICYAVAGYLVESSWGYPSLFYIYAALGFIWMAFWFFLGSNNPDEHPSIEIDELHYIKATLQQKEEIESIPTPWKEMLTSPAFLSIVFSHFIQNWSFVTLLTEIPTYMEYVLEYDISHNGLLSACPYVAMGLMSFVYGGIVDYFINRGVFSITMGRKCANALGFLGPATCLMILGAIDSTKASGITLLIVSLTLNGAINSGFQVNHVDLSPRFSGTEMGITNTAGTLASIFGPLSVQYIVTEDTNSSQWAVVFYLSAILLILGTFVFSLFASGQVQSWNEGPEQYRSKKTVKQKGEV